MRRLLTRLSLVGLSLGGLLTAHWLAFLFAAPHTHERAELLTATGHGSWMPLALAVVTSALLASMRRSGFGWSSLALLQMTGFVVLEGVERIGAHDGLMHLLHEPVFYIGLTVQLVVSLIATLLVRVAREVARLFTRSFSGRRTAKTSFGVVGYVRRVSSVAAEAWNLRGPPSPLAF